jgi:fructose-1,6-bisphosphatase
LELFLVYTKWQVSFTKTQKDTKNPGTSDVLRAGSEVLVAGYCMYGSSTVMVITTGANVNGYTLDPNIGEFLLTHKNVISTIKTRSNLGKRKYIL